MAICPCFLSAAALHGMQRSSPVVPLCTYHYYRHCARPRHPITRVMCAAETNPSEDDCPAPAAIPDLSSQQSEREVLESLTSSGASSLHEIGGTVQEELEAVSDATRAFADGIIAEETEALLDRYDARQKELLAAMEGERRVIETEMARIQELADSVRSRDEGVDDMSNRKKMLAAAAGLFAIAALLYACTGIVDGDTDSLRNAGIDAVVAGAAVFFFNREKEGRTSGTKK